MIILKEAKKREYNSIEAYYELDPGDPDEDVTIKEEKYVFMWHRRKSNENVKEKGFSFYLARHVFKDADKIVDPELASDPGNTGIAGIVRGNDKVMIVLNAKSDILEKGIIRIVSAYYTTDQNLIWRYNHIKKLRRKYESMMPSEEELDKLAEHNKRIFEEYERKHSVRFF